MSLPTFCKCRCPCHAHGTDPHPVPTNLINLDQDQIVPLEPDGMSWAQGCIRSSPVDPTYPHPPHHHPFGENWSSSSTKSSNPFKTALPKAQKVVSKTLLQMENFVKTKTAWWESLCDSSGDQHHKFFPGSRRSKSADKDSSQRGSGCSEGDSSARASFDSEGSAQSTEPDPFELTQLHPSNPFLAEELEPTPPPLPPRLPSSLVADLSAHSLYCSELHAKMEAEGISASPENSFCFSGENPSSEKMDSSSNMINSTTGETWNDSEQRESHRKTGSSCSTNPQSESAEGIVLLEPKQSEVGPEAEEIVPDSQPSSFSEEGNRDSFESEALEEETDSKRNSQCASNQTEAGGEEDTQNPEENADGQCQDKTNMADASVQTTLQRYRAEMNITLENNQESPPPPPPLPPFPTTLEEAIPEPEPISADPPNQVEMQARYTATYQYLAYNTEVSHDYDLPIDNDNDAKISSSDTERLEMAVSIVDSGSGSFYSNHRSLDKGGGDIARHTLPKNQLLTKLSESFDSVQMTSPSIQVESIGRSVLLPNSQPATSSKPDGGKKAFYRTERNLFHTCVKCKKLVDTSEPAFHLPGFCASWHAHCFQCRICCKTLAEKEHGLVEDHPYCLEHFARENASSSYPTCEKCKAKIQDKSYTLAGGQSWHADHFTCEGCQSPIVSTKYVLVEEGQPYCFLCHEANFPKYCRACEGRIFPQDPYVNSGPKAYWHSNPGCLHCKTCGGSLVGRAIFFRKGDGKLYCNRYCAIH